MRKIMVDNLYDGKKRIKWEKQIGKDIEFIYDDISGVLKIVKYDLENNKRIYFEYNGKIYDMFLGNFTKCRFSTIVGKIKKEYLYNIGEQVNGFEILKQTRRRSNERAYVVKCLTCGCIDDKPKTEDHLKNGCGCGICYGMKVAKGINDVATTHPHLVKYFANPEDAYKYTYSSDKNVIGKCEFCGTTKRVQVKSIHINNGICCPKCSDTISYPNKFMFNLLKQLNIDFETEYSPEWIGRKRYDFYIPSKKLIIEMDGGFHYTDNSMSGQTKEEAEAIDYLKDKEAESHGLDIIRINCNYNDISERLSIIKNNTIKELRGKFDLDEVDWEEIDMLSIDSKMKQAWQLWNIHKEKDKYFTTTDLSKLMKINRTSIKKYLAKGRDFGLCNYDEYEERTLKCEKMCAKTSKKVEIFKNGVSLGVFNSCGELERKSLELIGVKLGNSKISKCARSGEEYKGFTFKYV